MPHLGLLVPTLLPGRPLRLAISSLVPLCGHPCRGLSVVALGLTLGCRTPHPGQPPAPFVALCTLPAATVQAAADDLGAHLRNDLRWSAAVVTGLGAPAATALQALPSPFCDDIASRLAAKGVIALRPVAIFQFGTGYLVYIGSGTSTTHVAIGIDDRLAVVADLSHTSFD